MVTQVQVNDQEPMQDYGQGTDNGSFGSPEGVRISSQQLAPEVSLEENEGGSRIQLRGGSNYTRTAVSSASASESDQGKLLATARDPQGHPTVSISDDSVLTMAGGLQMRAEQALQSGLIKKDSNGNYTELDGSVPQSISDLYEQARGEQERISEEQAELDNQPIAPNAPMDSSVVETVDYLNETLGQEATVDLANSIIANDLDTSGLVNDVAYRMGTDPDSVSESLKGTIEGYKGQAAAFIQSQAPETEPEKVFQWARNNMSEGEVSAAVREHVVTRNMRGYANMLKAFQVSQAGEAMGTAGSGLVVINGMEMQKSQAIALGLIKG